MKTIKAIPEELKNEIREEYEKVWKKDEKMIKFCCGEISRAIRIEDGMIFIWEKPRINTRFCFGYSDDSTGEDYMDALRMANHARQSHDYFIQENLKDLDGIISALEGNGEGYYSTRQPYIMNHSYCSYGDIKLCQLKWLNTCDCLDLREDERKRIRLPYTEEYDAILAGYKAEREAFLKRLEAYLKRYGMTKVESWSYWRDE